MSKNKSTTVILVEPIDVEGKEPLKTVSLRMPLAGELRGLSFTKVMELDVETMVTLIPRISELTVRDMENLDPVNMPPLFTGIVGFFVRIDSPVAITE